MTIVLKIKGGSKHMFFNAIDVVLKEPGAVVMMSDRLIPAVVQGFIERIERKG